MNGRSWRFPLHHYPHGPSDINGRSSAKRPRQKQNGFNAFLGEPGEGKVRRGNLGKHTENRGGKGQGTQAREGRGKDRR